MAKIAHLSPSIESGNSVGDVFVRYDAPAVDIEEAITGYHIYARLNGVVENQVDWFLPGTANVRIAIDAGPLLVKVGSQNFRLSQASLFGPTSHAMRGVSNGGYLIGFGISAVGWARLGLRAASGFLDRIVPLDDLLGRDIETTLIEQLSASDRDVGVKPLLDAILRPLVSRRHPDEPLIFAVSRLVLDNAHVSVELAAAELGMSQRTLRRITTRYFGMTPKLLLSRARFLRSFLAVIADERNGYDAIKPAYHDVPHFLRDARRFLGMTPLQFHLLRTPVLDASLRIRSSILGSPTQALHRIE